MTHKACDICSCRETIREFALPTFDLYRCPGCNHFSSRLKVLPKRYAADYFFDEYKEHFQRPDRKLHARICRLIQKYAGDGLKVLDVGTAIGFLPKQLNEAGYESYGIDISSQAVAYGTNQLKIPRLQAIPLERFQPNTAFPVITNTHVVEHLPDPMPFFKEIRRLLDDRGMFICVTVNSNSLIFALARFFYRLSGGKLYRPLQRVCDVHHLQHFTRHSLAYALRRSGFEVISRFQCDMPLFTLSLTFPQKIFVAGMYLLGGLLGSYFLQGIVCRKI